MRAAGVAIAGVVVGVLLVGGCSSDAGAPASSDVVGGGDGDGGASAEGGRSLDGAGPNGGDGGGSSIGGGAPPTIGGCDVFPAGDAWNTPVGGMAVDETWTAKLYANAKLKKLHPDFGSTFGVPINVVPSNEPMLSVVFGNLDESDPGPYPFLGASSSIEGGTPTSCSGDCHVLTILQGSCQLYEGDACLFSSPSTWHCYSGARWDLTRASMGQRTKGFTSADAAGLAIAAGLVRFDEVAAGEIRHAIRFTMHCIQDGFVAPASHEAVSNGPSGCNGIDTTTLRDQYPPMGTRVRLKPSFDTSSLPAQARVVAVAMQRYGMILADNGSDYYFQGEPNAGFDDTQLDALKAIGGDQFEVLSLPTIER